MQFAGRAVCWYTIGISPSPETKQGQVCRLSNHIPERYLKRPVAGIVKCEHGENIAVPLHLADFLSDEQVLELFEAIHFVARAVAHQSLISMHLDNCRRKLRPHQVIPG